MAFLHPPPMLAAKRLGVLSSPRISGDSAVSACRHARTMLRMQGGSDNSCTSKPGKVLFSFEEARKYARSFGFSSREEFEEYGCAGAYRLPKRPDLVYPKEWKGWDDWLGTMLPFSEARERARMSGIQSEEEWRARVQEGPDAWLDARIPVKPDSFPPYAEDWKGWKDWLGVD
uniref:Uncharacterized protein n=1 Tax=Guillardia theta TaxID=55529 RepID=A0A7S4U7A6_GUITH